MTIAASNRSAMDMDNAIRHLVANYSPSGNRVGWLMMSSILVEAWDLYSIAFVLVFIRDQYHPSALLLVHLFKGRIDSRFHWPLPQNLRAERMDGSD